MIVTGWRFAVEIALGMLIFWLAISSWNWFQTGVFKLLSDTAPLPEQLVFWAAMLSGLFALL